MTKYYSDMHLRNKVYRMLTHWPDKPQGSLPQLLGYSRPTQMQDQFNERDRQICEMLLGPHGKAIYHMLIARKNNV